MKNKIILLLLFVFTFFVNASFAQVIITVAGNGSNLSPVPGTQATSSGILSNAIAVDKIENHFFSIANPAYGRYEFQQQDFLECWAAGGTDGYALLFSP